MDIIHAQRVIFTTLNFVLYKAYTPEQPSKLFWHNDLNYNINLIENSSITNTISIWVTWDNSIIKAYSLDKNNNWYIDGYEIYFAENTLNSNITWLKVWDENVISYVWNSSSWIINFDDNIFTTWELPQITSNGITFWNVWIIWNTSIIEEDKAKPTLLNINSWNNINWTDDLVLNFSEILNTNISTSSKYILKDKNNTIINFIWTYSNTWKTFIINPDITLYSDKNPFSIFINDIEDWWQNKLNTIINFSIVQNVCSISNVTNWSVWSFPDCVIICDNWYTKSGNSCIANSGWWWGGGWGVYISLPQTKPNQSRDIIWWWETSNWTIISSSWNTIKWSAIKLGSIDTYITKFNRNWVIIFRTKNEKIKTTMWKIENIILTKFDKLLANKQITWEKYNTSIKNYNNFVLYLSIYRKIKLPESKVRWKYYLAEVIKVYNIKLIKKIVIKPIVLQEKVVWDYYNFSKDLKVWDYSDDVKKSTIFITILLILPFNTNLIFLKFNKWIFKKICRKCIESKL